MSAGQDDDAARRKATIYDVAREAGVTISSVSRAFGRPGEIGAKTRERIFEISRRLNYRPNALAGSLTTKRTLLLGLVVADIRNPSVAALARGVQDETIGRRYLCILCSTSERADSGVSMLEEMMWRGVDGIVITSSYGLLDDSLLDFVENRPEPKVPLVFVGRQQRASGIDAVSPQGYQGGCMAVSHLIERGHRRIACLSGHHAEGVAVGRWQAYRETLEAAGIAQDPTLCAAEATTHEGGLAAMRRLLELPEPPSAVFAVNDLMAFGAIEAIRERGLSVPGDISVVGFDDIPAAALSDPKLTTVAQPSYDIGVTAARMLLSRIDDPSLPTRLELIDCELRSRGSVRDLRRSPG